jgi:hypothetical protein
MGGAGLAPALEKRLKSAPMRDTPIIHGRALRAVGASSQTKRTAGMVGIPLAGILRRGWGASVP